jgi:hypothetical protein
MLVHRSYQRFKRVWPNHRIAIEQHDISPLGYFQSLIVRPGESFVSVITDQNGVWKPFSYRFCTPIGRAIVHYDGLLTDALVPFLEGLKALLQKLARVVINYDER